MKGLIEKILERLEELQNYACFPTEWVNEEQSKIHSYYANKLTEILKLTEQYNNGWLPCSERLPEDRDWYLAVFEEADTGFIGLPYIAHYLMGAKTKFTTEDGWIIHNCTDREDVSSEYYKKLRCVAWQPLPKPYKERD